MSLRATRALTAACVLAAGAVGAAAAVQTRAPGACHVRGKGRYVEPDPRCTPGAVDPRVTQATAAETICTPGWSSRQRPPERVTEPQKRAAIAAYGDYDGTRLSAYELDHLIPLELGGAPDDQANLWPEPRPNPKDALENRLHALVCHHQVPLATARRAIATDWVGALRRYG